MGGRRRTGRLATPLYGYSYYEYTAWRLMRPALIRFPRFRDSRLSSRIRSEILQDLGRHSTPRVISLVGLRWPVFRIRRASINMTPTSEYTRTSYTYMRSDDGISSRLWLGQDTILRVLATRLPKAEPLNNPRSQRARQRGALAPLRLWGRRELYYSYEYYE